MTHPDEQVSVTQAGHWVTMACPICGVGKSEPCVDTMGHRHPSSHPERRVWSTFAHRIAAQSEREAARPCECGHKDCDWGCLHEASLQVRARSILQSDLGPLTDDFDRLATDDQEEVVDRLAGALAALTTPTPAECPSCGGLNTSCPEGCGRDPKTGELNGTTPTPAVPVEEIVAALADMCGAAEYWAGCDEGCTPEAASDEIMRSGGCWPAQAYDKARAILSRLGERP